MSNINYSGEHSLTKLIELIKGSLSNKQDKLTAGDNITITNNVISSPLDIFYCEYGTTTQTQIINAVNNGKLPVCIRSNRVYVLENMPSGTFVFTAVQGNTHYYLTLTTANVWGTISTALATTANLNTKQDKLTAGTNITIDANNVISAASGGGELQVTHFSRGFVDITFSDTAATVMRINYKFIEINEGLIYFYYKGVLPDITGKYFESATSSTIIPAWAIPTDSDIDIIQNMTPTNAVTTALTTYENTGFIIAYLDFASGYPAFIVNKNSWTIPEGGTPERNRAINGMLSYYTI